MYKNTWKKDELFVNPKERKIKDYSSFFPKYWNRRFAEYFLGVIQGDGYIRKNMISITIGIKDKDYAYLLKDLIEEKFGFIPKLHLYDDIFRLEIYNMRIYEQYKSFKNKGKWKIPSLLFPEEYFAGLIDTDGYISKGSIELSQKDNGNMELIIPLIKKFGFFKTNLNLKITNNYIVKGYRNKLWNIHSSKDVLNFFQKIPIKHPRKIRILNESVKIKKNFNKTPNNYNYQKILNFIKNISFTKKDIRDNLGFTRSVVDWNVDRLLNEKRVEKVKFGVFKYA